MPPAGRLGEQRQIPPLGTAQGRNDNLETEVGHSTMADDQRNIDRTKSDQEKEAAARASLPFVEDGQVVGLGTGSTAAHFIQLLAERVKAGLKIRGIPTSVRSEAMAKSLGIPLTTLDECQEIAVTVDGADEVDPQLGLINGGGGASLRDKIGASPHKHKPM